MKRILFLFISFFVLFSVYADADQLIKYEETENLGGGITLTKVAKAYGAYNISYSYIKADLGNTDVELKLLKSKDGVDTLETVESLAASENNVIAATNADFFSYFSGNKGFSLGLEYKNGEILQTPINTDEMAGGYLYNDSLLLSYLTFHRMLVAPNWNYIEIRHLNKHTTYYGDILMYTSLFNGGYSPAPGGDTVEMVVDNGIVTEFRRNLPPVLIPKDGYVLLVSEGMNTFLGDNFQIGDEVKLDLYASPELDDLTMAFGGGTMLLKDGQKTVFKHMVNGNNPRTAIGTDKTGKIVYLVAVDGRQEESRGVTQSELADIMLEIGCANALNLDGGGSTRLLAQTLWNDALHAVNSPTENRKVINGLGITYKRTPSEAVGIEIKTEKDTVYVGDSFSVSAKLYDKNHIEASSDLPIVFKATSGSVSGNIFTAEEQGVSKIYAVCGDLKSNAVEVSVLDEVCGIKMPNEFVLKPGETIDLNLSVFDSMGVNSKVDHLDDFNIEIDEKIANIENGQIIATETGNTLLKISKGNCSAYAAVYVSSDGERATKIVTPQNEYDDRLNFFNDGETFKIAAVPNENPNGLHLASSEKIRQRLMEADVAAYVGKCVNDDYDIMSPKTFKTAKIRDSAYICLNQESMSRENWEKFSAVATGDSKNIFIMSNSFDFGGEFSKTAFCDYLGKISENKNVFMIYRGERNELQIINGVRYFSLADINCGTNVIEKMETLSDLTFYINGDSVSYVWDKVLGSVM